MTNAEIQASIASILADQTKTPLYSLLGLSSIDYQIEAERMVRSAIAKYEPRAEVMAVEFSDGLKVLWQPLTHNIMSDTYPNYSSLPPQEAADKLVEYALAQYLGSTHPQILQGGEVVEEIRRAVESDARLSVVTVSGHSNGYQVEIVSSAAIEKILRYDSISQYDGTWSY
ncbi:MAG: GPW/gp25 family protein [Symploca sp. SIO1B1]|nr:GPW/gp25 family protein [Symploca sp. SIO1A3]NER95362.1 GPW/gp25 family protein [Symploca sp. SIO1B1]